MRSIFIICLLALPFTTLAQDKSLYKIYDTKNKKEVGVEDIVKAFSAADVLFFGEEHDDSIGHMLQAEVFRQSHKAIGKDLMLSMEMFEADVQLVLDEYLAGLIQEKNLIKEGRAWKNYSDYKPMVEYAKANQVPVIAANTPPRYTNAVTRGGLEALSKFSIASRSWLPPPVDTATGRYYEKFLEIMGGHGVMPGMHIYQSQNLWDATMAYSIYKAFLKNTNAKILHLNGRFHSDEKMGIIAQLNKYTKDNPLKILNISSFYSEGDLEKPDWNKYTNLGDYVIITKNLKEEKKD